MGDGPDRLREFIHSFAPHSPSAIYLSCALTILAVLAIANCIHVTTGRKKLPQGQLLRIAFAAGPEPIYLLLPLAPLDPELGTALMGQQFTLLLAGMYGLAWTWTDIKLLATG
jgi:hypothetical protein